MVYYSCCMAGATWNCCRLSASSVYTINPCPSLHCHFIQSSIGKVHVCLAVNLPSALLAEWSGSFTCYYYGNTGVECDTEVRVSTERWTWRLTKFSRRSCGDSNPGRFDHESGALTSELPPILCGRWALQKSSLLLLLLLFAEALLDHSCEELNRQHKFPGRKIKPQVKLSRATRLLTLQCW